MNRIPKRHPDAGVERVMGRLLAVSPDSALCAFEEPSGEVSPVAERIVELVDGQRTLGQIVQQLLAEFEVEEKTCAEDAVAFVEQLVSKSVLAWA